MSHPNRNQYAPDSVTPPGFYIREKLEEIGMTESGLATAIGLPALGEIVGGKAPIGPEVARRLERALGIPAHFWTNVERRYRESLERASGGLA